MKRITIVLSCIIAVFVSTMIAAGEKKAEAEKPVPEKVKPKDPVKKQGESVPDGKAPPAKQGSPRKPSGEEESGSSEKPSQSLPGKTDPKKNESREKKEGDALQGSSGDELLNMATTTKLSAKSYRDLTKVINLCRAAEKKGLSPENLEFCRQLRLSTQLQRGLSLGKVFLSDNITLEELSPSWRSFRKQILDDLTEVLKEIPEEPSAQLVVGRLNMLPEGDEKVAEKSLDLAIQYSQEEPAVQVEALRYRAELEEDDTKKEEMLKKALSLSDENAGVLFAVASHWLEVKRYDKALEAIDRALKLVPDVAQYKRVRAHILARLERYDEAEQCYDSAGGNRKDLMSRIQKAQFFLAIHQPDKALALYNQMISTNEMPLLYYYRALAYLTKKDYIKALKDVNECLRIDSKKNPSMDAQQSFVMNEAIQLKAAIYLQQEKYDDAIRIYETLKGMKPDDMVVLSQLAYAFAKKGDIDQALKTLAEPIKKQPDNVDLLRCRGDIELMFGRWSDTIATYERILKLRPKDSGVLNNYSWLLSTSPVDSVRNGKKALKFALLAAQYSHYAEAHVLSTLGAAYAELGQFDKALEWSNKAVELATREKHERLDDLKKESESYKAKRPWREEPEALRKQKAEKTSDKTKADKKNNTKTDKKK